MTSYNSAFGWVHGFKMNDNNPIFGVAHLSQSPFYPIVPEPTWKQIVKNWNVADTSIMLISIFASTLIAHRIIRSYNIASLMQKRQTFIRITGYSAITGFFLGYRNSYYRLVGLVPNGMNSREPIEPVKYDYTTKFLEESFWQILFSPPKKPSQ